VDAFYAVANLGVVAICLGHLNFLRCFYSRLYPKGVYYMKQDNSVAQGRPSQRTSNQGDPLHERLHYIHTTHTESEPDDLSLRSG
jgi:hypothetical protein